MAKNYVHDGHRVVVAAAPAGGVTAGVPVKVGGKWLVPLDSAAAGSSFTGAIGGCWTVKKATGAIAQLALVYWDAAAKAVTTTASGNTLLGAAELAAASGDATVPVLINAEAS